MSLWSPICLQNGRLMSMFFYLYQPLLEDCQFFYFYLVLSEHTSSRLSLDQYPTGHLLSITCVIFKLFSHQMEEGRVYTYDSIYRVGWNESLCDC